MSFRRVTCLCLWAGTERKIDVQISTWRRQGTQQVLPILRSGRTILREGCKTWVQLSHTQRCLSRGTWVLHLLGSCSLLGRRPASGSSLWCVMLTYFTTTTRAPAFHQQGHFVPVDSIIWSFYMPDEWDFLSVTLLLWIQVYTDTQSDNQSMLWEHGTLIPKSTLQSPNTWTLSHGEAVAQTGTNRTHQLSLLVA